MEPLGTKKITEPLGHKKNTDQTRPNQTRPDQTRPDIYCQNCVTLASGETIIVCNVGLQIITRALT